MQDDKDFDDLAGKVSGEAYQVIGALANAAGLWDHPEVVRALDYFGYEHWRQEDSEILPFGAGLQPQGGAAAVQAAENARRAEAIHEDAEARRKRLRHNLRGR